MRILFITSLAFRKASSASIRNISVINGLVENGHEIDLLTIKYPKEYEDEYLKKNLKKEVNVYSQEISIVNKYLNSKIKTNDFEKKNSLGKKLMKILKKIVKDIYFFPDTDKDWIEEAVKIDLDKNYDLIISSSDTKTSHFVGEKIKQKMKKSVKWYQIWGDPWYLDVNIKGVQKFRAKKNEEKIIKKSDKVFYVSKFTLQSMKEMYPKLSNKMNYFPRPYLSSIKGREYGKNNEWIFSYTGSINKHRSIYNFLLQIEKFNSESLKRIKLNIYGNIDEEVKKQILEFNFINLKGIVDYEKILNVYKESDVLVFVDNGANSTQIPGKIFDYFGTDRQIVALFESDQSIIKRFLSSNNRCLIHNIESEFDFSQLLNKEKLNILNEYSGKYIANIILKGE